MFRWKLKRSMNVSSSMCSSSLYDGKSIFLIGKYTNNLPKDHFVKIIYKIWLGIKKLCKKKHFNNIWPSILITTTIVYSKLYVEWTFLLKNKRHRKVANNTVEEVNVEMILTKVRTLQRKTFFQKPKETNSTDSLLSK